ncbi:carboxypeptidase-like regulatory domain-containing protein [Balneolaceae bacterium ANBcel3]|nr:carboxypeptidase-like regulatory domain-containing protein [Balneolaceae bacterium ANBcel3]
MLQHIAYFITASILFVLLAFVPMDEKDTEATLVIKGTVVCAETEEPVVFAEVLVTERSSTAVTNTDGEFELNGLEAGTYEIVVNADGFAQKKKEITLEEEFSVTIALKSD